MVRARDGNGRGRGRLSALDQLPPWADEIKLWAFNELKERKRAQLEILDEFNERLKTAAWSNGVTDQQPVSRSAFNRTAMRLAVLGRRLEETREIAAVLAPKLDKAGDDSITLLIAESIKMLIHEMLSNAGEVDANGATAQMLMFAAQALRHTETAKNQSQIIRERRNKELVTETNAAVDHVAKTEGLSADTVEKIKAKILGITRDPPETKQ
jgi:hypothetical protein